MNNAPALRADIEAQSGLESDGVPAGGQGGRTASMSARLQLDEKRPGRGKSSSGPVVFRALYWTFSEKSSTTNEVWSEESSAPIRYTWIVCPLKADTSKVFKL